MTFIKHIIRYPIKGLNGNFIDKIKLLANETIEGDRKFAFAKFDNEISENSPIYMKKVNFLALVKEEKLSLLNSQLNLENNKLELFFEKKIFFSGSLNDKEDLNKLSNCISKFLDISLRKKPRLVTDKSGSKNTSKHSFSDIPDKAISFINLQTIRDFEKKINTKINFSRFRGNIIFDDLKAWKEFHWIGKIIQIGDVKINIFRKTKRCAATNVNPENGLRDLNIPNQLYKNYGHDDLGVYGKVLNQGEIKINDKIRLIKV